MEFYSHGHSRNKCMIQGLLRRHSFLGWVDQATVYEIYQAFIGFVLENLLNGLTAWYERLRAQATVFWPDELERTTVTVWNIEVGLIGTLLNDFWSNVTQGYCVEFQQFILILGRKQRTTIDHLEKNAAEWPHVDRVAVGHAEDDLRCSIHSALHVWEAGLVALTACSEIYNFDLICILISKEYILWLDIAMNNTLILHIKQSFADLFGYLLDLVITKRRHLAPLHHHFLIEVNIKRQALEDDDDTILEHQRVLHK